MDVERLRLVRALGPGRRVHRGVMQSRGGQRRVVAVELLPGAMPGAALARLEQDVTRLTQAQVPGVARVLGLVALPEGWGVVSELVPGKDARELLQEAGRVPLGVALRICVAVAEALEGLTAAGERLGQGSGLCHGGLRLEAVRVGSHGQVWLVSMAARRVDPSWAAPEVRQGGRPSSQGDVYATGLLLTTLLLGRVPELGASERGGHEELTEMLLGRLRTALADQRAGRGVAAFVRASLAWDAEARPTASEAAADLAALALEVGGTTLELWAGDRISPYGEDSVAASSWAPDPATEDLTASLDPGDFMDAPTRVVPMPSPGARVPPPPASSEIVLEDAGVDPDERTVVALHPSAGRPEAVSPAAPRGGGPARPPPPRPRPPVSQRLRPAPLRVAEEDEVPEERTHKWTAAPVPPAAPASSTRWPGAALALGVLVVAVVAGLFATGLLPPRSDPPPAELPPALALPTEAPPSTPRAHPAPPDAHAAAPKLVAPAPPAPAPPAADPPAAVTAPGSTSSAPATALAAPTPAPSTPAPATSAPEPPVALAPPSAATGSAEVEGASSPAPSPVRRSTSANGVTTEVRSEGGREVFEVTTPPVTVGQPVGAVKFVVAGATRVTVTCGARSGAGGSSAVVRDAPSGPCSVVAELDGAPRQAVVVVDRSRGYTCTLRGTSLQCS